MWTVGRKVRQARCSCGGRHGGDGRHGPDLSVLAAYEVGCATVGGRVATTWPLPFDPVWVQYIPAAVMFFGVMELLLVTLLSLQSDASVSRWTDD